MIFSFWHRALKVASNIGRLLMNTKSICSLLFFVASTLAFTIPAKGFICPDLGGYTPFAVSTGDLVIVPTKVPKVVSDIAAVPQEAVAYSCISLQETYDEQSLFIYNTQRDVTLSYGDIKEYLSNQNEICQADIVYIDILSQKPVVLSKHIRAYNKIKELRIRCNTTLTLSNVRIDDIERLVIENTADKASYTIFTGALESNGSVIVNADSFLCSASIKLGGELSITARKCPVFRASRAQDIQAHTFFVHAHGQEPIVFVPELGSKLLASFQTVKVSDSIMLQTQGELSIFGWNFTAGNTIALTGGQSDHAALISLDSSEFKAGGAIDCRAHAAEIFSSSLMAYSTLSLMMPEIFATRTSLFFSNDRLTISTKKYKDELSLVKSCESIALTVDDTLALLGTRLLAAGTIELTDGDAGTRVITSSRIPLTHTTQDVHGQITQKQVYEGEMRSLYGSIRVKGREYVSLTGMMLHAGEDVEVNAHEGNVALKALRDESGLLLGGIQAGADNTSYFEIWFKEAIKSDDGEIRPHEPFLSVHASGTLLNELQCTSTGSLELKAGDGIRTIATIQASKASLSAFRVENGIDQKRQLVGSIYAPTVSIDTGTSGRILNTGRIGAGKGSLIFNGERFVNKGIIEVDYCSYTLADAFVADGFIFCNGKNQAGSLVGDLKRMVVRGIIKTADSLEIRTRHTFVLKEEGLLVAPSVHIESPFVSMDGLIQQRFALVEQDKDYESLWGKASIQTRYCWLGKDTSFDSLHIKADNSVDVTGTLMARDGVVEVPTGRVTLRVGSYVLFRTSSLKDDKGCSVGVKANQLINYGHMVVKDAWCPSTEQLDNYHEVVAESRFDVDAKNTVLSNRGTITSPYIKAHVASLIGQGTLNSTSDSGLGISISAQDNVELGKLIARNNAYIVSKKGRIALSDAHIQGSLVCRGAPQGVYLEGKNIIGNMHVPRGALEGSVTLDGQLVVNDVKRPSALECSGTLTLSGRAHLDVHGDMEIKAGQGIEIAGDIAHDGAIYFLTPGVMTFTGKVCEDGSRHMPKFQSTGLVVLSASSINGQVALSAGEGVLEAIDGIKVEGFISTRDAFRAIAGGEYVAQSLEIGGDGYIEADKVAVQAKEHVGGHYKVITNDYHNPTDHAVVGTFSLLDPRVNGTLFDHLIKPQKGLVFDSKHVHTAPNETVVFYGDKVVLNHDMYPYYWQSETYGKGLECHTSVIKSKEGFYHDGGHVLIGCAIETPDVIKLGGQKLLVTKEFEWAFDVAECLKRGLPCCHVSTLEPFNGGNSCPAADSLNVKPLWNDRPKWTKRGAMNIRKMLDHSGELKAGILHLNGFKEGIQLEGASVDVRQLEVHNHQAVRILPVLVLARSFHQEWSTCKKGRCVQRDSYTAYYVTSILPSILHVKDDCIIATNKNNLEIVDSYLTINGSLALVDVAPLSPTYSAEYGKGGLLVQDQTYPSLYGRRCADWNKAVYCEEGTFVEMKNKKLGLQSALVVGSNATIHLGENFIFWGASADFFSDLDLIAHGNFSVKPIELHNNLGMGGHQGAGVQLLGIDSHALTDGRSDNAISKQVYYEGPGQGVDFLGGNVKVHNNARISIGQNVDIPGGAFVVGKNLSALIGKDTRVAAVVKTYLDKHDSWKRGHSWSTSASIRQGVMAAGENADIVVGGAFDAQGGAVVAGSELNATAQGINATPLSVWFESHYEHKRKKLFSSSSVTVHQKQEQLVPFMVAGAQGTHLNSQDGKMRIGFGCLGTEGTPTTLQGKNIEVVPNAQRSELYYQKTIKGFHFFGLGGALDGGSPLKNIIDSLPIVREVKMLQSTRQGEKAGIVVALADATTRVWADPSTIVNDIFKAGVGYTKSRVDGRGYQSEPRFPVLAGNVLIEVEDTFTYGGAKFKKGHNDEVTVRASKIKLKPVERTTRFEYETYQKGLGVSINPAGLDCTRASQNVRYFGYAVERSAPVIVSQHGIGMIAEHMQGPLLINAQGVAMDIDEVRWEPAISESFQTTSVRGHSFGIAFSAHELGPHTGLNKQEALSNSIKVDGGGVNAQEFLATGKEWHLGGTKIDAQKGYLNVTRLFTDDPHEFEKVNERQRSIHAGISLSFTWQNVRDIFAEGALAVKKRLDEYVAQVLTTIAPGIAVNEKETQAARSINRNIDQTRYVLRHSRSGSLYYVPLLTPAALEARINGIRQTNEKLATVLKEKLKARKDVNTSPIEAIEAMVSESPQVFSQEEVETLYQEAESRLENEKEDVVKQKDGVWVADFSDKSNEQTLVENIPLKSTAEGLHYNKLGEHSIELDLESDSRIQSIKEGVGKFRDRKFMITFKSASSPEQIMEYVLQNYRYFTYKDAKERKSFFQFFKSAFGQYALSPEKYDLFFRGKQPDSLSVGSRVDVDGPMLIDPHLIVVGATSTSVTFATGKKPTPPWLEWALYADKWLFPWWSRGDFKEYPEAILITASIDRIDDKTTFIIHVTSSMYDEVFDAAYSRGLGEKAHISMWSHFCEAVKQKFGDKSVQSAVEVTDEVFKKESIVK